MLSKQNVSSMSKRQISRNVGILTFHFHGAYILHTPLYVNFGYDGLYQCSPTMRASCALQQLFPEAFSHVFGGCGGGGGWEQVIEVVVNEEWIRLKGILLNKKSGKPHGKIMTVKCDA